jgi:hypothetical protein
MAKRILQEEPLMSNKDMEEELKTALRMHWALEMLGLPDTSDPNFDAQVVFAAYRLGLMQRKP